MTYHMGQQVPFDYSRTIVGEALKRPAWYALKVPPMKESTVRQYLKARGIHSCYPERETSWQVKGRHFSRKLPVITQIVYVKFDREPQWDVMKARRLITGVFSRGAEPIRLHGDIIRAVMGLPTEAERLEAARLELLRPRVNEKARLKEGPLADFLVDVESVNDDLGKVWWKTITGMKGETTLDKIERVLPDDA